MRAHFKVAGKIFKGLGTRPMWESDPSVAKAKGAVGSSRRWGPTQQFGTTWQVPIFSQNHFDLYCVLIVDLKKH